MARNVRIRRLIAEILFTNGSMTKTQMFSHLEKNHRLLKEPTEHSISSMLNKNSQVIPVGSATAYTESGNKTTHTLFDVNREVIHTYEDLVKTMPVALLTSDEAKDAKRCPRCARVRILGVNGLCLECDHECSIEGEQ